MVASYISTKCYTQSIIFTVYIREMQIYKIYIIQGTFRAYIRLAELLYLLHVYICKVKYRLFVYVNITVVMLLDNKQAPVKCMTTSIL